MEKVNCLECNKKIPHAHKGCNEPNEFKRIIGNVSEYNERKRKDGDVRINRDKEQWKN